MRRHQEGWQDSSARRWRVRQPQLKFTRLNAFLDSPSVHFCIYSFKNLSDFDLTVSLSLHQCIFLHTSIYMTPSLIFPQNQPAAVRVALPPAGGAAVCGHPRTDRRKEPLTLALGPSAPRAISWATVCSRRLLSSACCRRSWMSIRVNSSGCGERGGKAGTS